VRYTVSFAYPLRNRLCQTTGNSTDEGNRLEPTKEGTPTEGTDNQPKETDDGDDGRREEAGRTVETTMGLGRGGDNGVRKAAKATMVEEDSGLRLLIYQESNTTLPGQRQSPRVKDFRSYKGVVEVGLQEL
jgi:hypothetical protein